jgi:hypothetical protein
MMKIGKLVDNNTYMIYYKNMSRLLTSIAILLLIISTCDGLAGDGKPLIISVTPNVLPLSGGTLTLSGFNFNTVQLPFVAIIPGTNIHPSFVSATQIIVTFPAGYGTGLTCYMGWVGDGGNLAQLPNAVSYVYPTITGVRTTTDAGKHISRCGTTIIVITGQHFGTNCSFYTYVEVGSGPAYTQFLSCYDDQIVVQAFGMPTDSGPSTLYLAWGAGPYTTFSNALCYCDDGSCQLPVPIPSCRYSPCYT